MVPNYPDQGARTMGADEDSGATAMSLRGDLEDFIISYQFDFNDAIKQKKFNNIKVIRSSGGKFFVIEANDYNFVAVGLTEKQVQSEFNHLLVSQIIIDIDHGIEPLSQNKLKCKKCRDAGAIYDFSKEISARPCGCGVNPNDGNG